MYTKFGSHRVIFKASILFYSETKCGSQGRGDFYREVFDRVPLESTLETQMRQNTPCVTLADENRSLKLFPKKFGVLETSSHLTRSSTKGKVHCSLEW